MLIVISHLQKNINYYIQNYIQILLIFKKLIINQFLKIITYNLIYQILLFYYFLVLQSNYFMFLLLQFLLNLMLLINLHQNNQSKLMMKMVL